MTTMIQAPESHPVLMLHHPPTLEDSTCPTKTKFLKKLHTVGFPLIGISSLNLFVACGSCTLQTTKSSLGATNTTPSSSLCIYGLLIQKILLWLIQLLLPHQICVGGQTQSPSQSRLKIGRGKKLSKNCLSNVTWPFKKSHPSQHLTCIINKFDYTNLQNYT